MFKFRCGKAASTHLFFSISLCVDLEENRHGVRSCRGVRCENKPHRGNGDRGDPGDIKPGGNWAQDTQ